MTMPQQRLFAVNVGVIDDEGIPDARLRSRTDQAAANMMTLLMAAGMSGQLTITHRVVKNTWTANIDADGSIFEKLELFNASTPEAISPSEAGARLTDFATQEICKFMAAQQPLNLAALQQSARHIKKFNSESPVVQVLRREPGQTVILTTRNGTLKLSLQGVNGVNLADEIRPVVCQIKLLGSDTAILKLPDGERQGIPASAGRLPRLAIPPSLSKEELLDKVFGYVKSHANVLLKVRDIEDRKTGKITGLQLEAWPHDEVKDAH
jgi:hypothetical protein